MTTDRFAATLAGGRRIPYRFRSIRLRTLRRHGHVERRQAFFGTVLSTAMPFSDR